MLLAIDVGNTNIVFALFANDAIVAQWRISTDVRRTMDEYAIIIRQMMVLDNLHYKDVNAVIISTVVPQNLFALKSLSKQLFGCVALVVGHDDVKTGLIIGLDKPSEVGADRIVNVVAAYDAYPQASIVVDFGTATTFDVISQNGTYEGGLIAPGINLSIQALHQAAAKLPEVAVRKPKTVIGKSTMSAMQSGIFFGYLGLIEGIVQRIIEESGDKIVIATGGLAPLFFEATNAINYLDDNLTINGLYKIYNMNK